ncbi:alpha/beta hydrolase family protein [Nocardia sp. NBC_01503]|uniref:alpha/beta hydrolase n=1 Tax=Nocardia sp. NBC_01503 TaxID=2975997 RepID=UPI002E7BEE61|nr:alpha/beta hydrolase [Nocardia sp. NBC_01503]WTL32671.1 alpha/beta hydrolase family protein [Nocardia sp. NBC_01503]
MRPTISQLEGWNLDGLSNAATAARSNAGTLDNSVSNCSRTLTSAQDWRGRTRDAATRRIDEEVDHGYEVRNLLLRLADDADDACKGLKHARDYVLQQKKLAEAQGFTVSPDGSVSSTDPEKADDAAVFQLNISSGLDEVERVDTAFGKSLAETQADLAAIRDGQQDITLPDGTRQDPDAVATRLTAMSPDERATFLAGLSTDDQRQLVIAAPEKLGNMNGVPFDMRIAANEINIQNALFDERQKPNPSQARIKQLESMLGQIPDPTTTNSHDETAVSSGPGATPGNHLVDRKFVLFDPTGSGRMIEMIGDIAPGVPGVGVIVPGTNTTLDGSNSNHVSAWNLSDRTHGPIFLYMDGDFPQGLADLGNGAPSPKFAAEMAPRLVDFGHELDREVAARAPGTPVTYVGHSYGGSIVGTAEQLGLRADRVLHASSAGTGIYSTEWNDPNPNVQRYSMTAPGDPIGIVQSYPRDGITLSGIHLPGNPHAGNPLNGDPDEIPGVTRLDTGFYGSEKDGHHMGEVVFGPNGHGKYWDDPGSTAFQNIVGVIAGGEVKGYVERGIETSWVDVGLGDDGDGAKEGFNAAEALAASKIPYAHIQPYADPRITENPQPGPTIKVR